VCMAITARTAAGPLPGQWPDGPTGSRMGGADVRIEPEPEVVMRSTWDRATSFLARMSANDRGERSIRPCSSGRGSIIAEEVRRSHLPGGRRAHPRDSGRDGLAMRVDHTVETLTGMNEQLSLRREGEGTSGPTAG